MPLLPEASLLLRWRSTGPITRNTPEFLAIDGQIVVFDTLVGTAQEVLPRLMGGRMHAWDRERETLFAVRVFAREVGPASTGSPFGRLRHLRHTQRLPGQGRLQRGAWPGLAAACALGAQAPGADRLGGLVCARHVRETPACPRLCAGGPFRGRRDWLPERCFIRRFRRWTQIGRYSFARS